MNKSTGAKLHHAADASASTPAERRAAGKRMRDTAPRNTHAAWQAPAPVSGIRVQACGDCHLMNFGGFATPERRLIFDINDLDETLPAPWEWDLKRLVASFVLAARSNGLSDAAGCDAATACAW